MIMEKKLPLLSIISIPYEVFHMEYYNVSTNTNERKVNSNEAKI